MTSGWVGDLPGVSKVELGRAEKKGPVRLLPSVGRSGQALNSAGQFAPRMTLPRTETTLVWNAIWHFSSFQCHPERSSCFAPRSSRAESKDLLLVRAKKNAERHSYDRACTMRIPRSATAPPSDSRSFDLESARKRANSGAQDDIKLGGIRVVVRFANDNFAQDDRVCDRTNRRLATLRGLRLFSFFRKSFIVRAPAALATIVAHLRHARMPSAVRFPETLLLIFPGASKGLSGAQTSPRTAKAQFHLQATIGSLFLFALARFGFQQELLANTLRDRMQACRQLEAPAFNRNLRHLLRRVLESLQCIRLLRIE